MMWRGLVLASVALIGTVLAGPGSAQQTTLRVGNWLPNHHLIVAGIIALKFA